MNWIQQFKQRVEPESPQPEPTPQPEVSVTAGGLERKYESNPSSVLKAVPTDRRESSNLKPIPLDERIKLERLLDEIFGYTWWREADEKDLLRLANTYHLLWEQEEDRQARIIAGVIWELTGHVEWIERLGYVVPWWYNCEGKE